MTDLSRCKPCPFCGNDHEEELTIKTYQDSYPWGVLYKANVICSCGVCGPDGDTQEKAVERWNARKGKITAEMVHNLPGKK